MIHKFYSLLRERRAFIQAVMVLTFLVIITALFTYPAQIWFVVIIGGVTSAAGVFLKRKMVITAGILVIGTIFYLSHLNLDISSVNIILLIGFFILFYGCGIYVHEFARLDIILKESRGEADKHFEQYMKKWKFSAFKYLTLSFLAAVTASLTSVSASFDRGVYQGQTIIFAASLLFAVSVLILTFILIVKLPTLYENMDQKR